MLFTRYLTAIHEAGHAIIAHQLGFPVEKVVITKCGGKVLFQLVDSNERDRRISITRARIFIGMSGWAATKSFGLETKDFLDCRNCRGDWKYIEYGGVQREDCEFLQSTILNLVEEELTRRRIEIVANQLEFKNALNRSQFLQIINSEV